MMSPLSRGALILVLGLMIVSCATPRQNFDLADLVSRAESGDNDAAFRLGLAHEQGRTSIRNLQEAARWYRVAAERGDAEAQNSLGSMYQFGEGVPRDYVAALEWYSKAAAQKHPMATQNLGYMFDRGLGVPEDNVRAAEFYQIAIDQGSVEAMVNLGCMLAQGESGVERDVVRAFMWLDLARFYTQFSSDKKLKWKARGALDLLQSRMKQDEVLRGEKLSREWDSVYGAKLRGR